MIWNLAEAIQADTGLDLAAYFVVGLPTTLAAVSALIIAVRSSRHNAEIRDQVSNDHSTNLRDDIDKINALVERIGDEVREDRVTRRAEDKAIIAHVDIRNKTLDEKVDKAIAWAESVIARHHPEDV